MDYEEIKTILLEKHKDSVFSNYIKRGFKSMNSFKNILKELNDILNKTIKNNK